MDSVAPQRQEAHSCFHCFASVFQLLWVPIEGSFSAKAVTSIHRLIQSSSDGRVGSCWLECRSCYG